MDAKSFEKFTTISLIGLPFPFWPTFTARDLFTFIFRFVYFFAKFIFAVISCSVFVIRQNDQILMSI